MRKLIRGADVLDVIDVKTKDGKIETRFLINKKDIHDVQEVRHAKWEYYGYIGDSDYFKCSDCGQIVSKETNYCPSCGAKMEEE